MESGMARPDQSPVYSLNHPAAASLYRCRGKFTRHSYLVSPAGTLPGR
jgi:hypothetical protein